jgi:molybdopterin converting factor small subunit
MVIQVRGILLRFTNFQNSIEIPGSTVREGLTGLIEQYPAISEVLLDREGSVRPTHLIALNGEQLFTDELDRAATEDDRVDIVTAVSGG